jgi:hypothetical protein
MIGKGRPGCTGLGTGKVSTVTVSKYCDPGTCIGPVRPTACAVCGYRDVDLQSSRNLCILVAFDDIYFNIASGRQCGTVPSEMAKKRNHSYHLRERCRLDMGPSGRCRRQNHVACLSIPAIMLVKVGVFGPLFQCV